MNNKYIKYKQRYMQTTHIQHGGCKLVGSFVIESGQVVAKDPGYNIMNGSIFSDMIIPVENGTWNTYIKYSTEQIFRISELIVCNQKFEDKIKNGKWKKITEVDVDTGQAGIFDVKYFRDDSVVDSTFKLASYVKIIDKGDKWYSMCCATTYDEKIKNYLGGAIPFGAVSSSGYGDGTYNVYGISVGKNIVALQIVFI